MQKNLKNKINESEKKTLLDTINKKTKILDIKAICVYGSRISGYAKKESDFDLIVVINNYKEKIRYQYIFNKINISAIFVDKKEILNDANNASLGEFVAGRLLNPYEVLLNKEFFEEGEYNYKKRVVKESINMLKTKHRSLIKYLNIPIEYFLFKRLNMRMKIYPPVKYSYIMTYHSKQGKQNIKKTLKVFERTIKDLQDEGIVSFSNGFIKIKNTDTNNILWNLILIKRTIKHYYIHGIAGRVKLNIVIKELFSKIDRNKKVESMSEYLARPEKLLRIT